MKTDAFPREQLQEEDEALLVDYLIVILKRKGIVLMTAIVFLTLSAVYIFSQPDIYKATAQVLIPQKSGQTLGGFAREGSILETLSGGPSYAGSYVSILESRTVADLLIEKFDLEAVYEKSSLVETRNALSQYRTIELSPDAPAILVSVEDRDPERAAEMANISVDALDRINRERNSTEGHLKRVFLEERLETVKVDLMEAEANLKAFQEKYNLVKVEEQAKAAIDGAAAIKGEIIRAETDLHVLKQFGTERQNAALRLKSRISELHKQLSLIEGGDRVISSGKRTPSNFYIPFNDLPTLMMTVNRLQREAMVQEELFKLVTTQYELAKIEEARDMETIQILDRAVPPDRKSGPNRKLFMGLGGAVGLFMGVLLAMVLEFRSQIREHDPERYRRLVRSFGVRVRI